MFIGTFTGTKLQWFVGLLDNHITYFDQFYGFFREQFIVNQAQPPVFRPFRCEAKTRRTFEGFFEQVWGVHSKAPDLG